jgi:peptidyl-prolyl cis-trans isomerase C
VKVNGVPIASSEVEQMVVSLIGQGQVDSPQLRAAIKNELIARQLLLQEAENRALERRPAVKDALERLRRSALLEFVVQDELSKKPISEAELRAEYDAQRAQLRKEQQYLLRQAVFATEAEAKALVAAVLAGGSFGALAKEKSLHESRAREGLLDWLLPSQIAPIVSNVIRNLPKGGMTVSPLNVGGVWHVIRVEDTREFVAPDFEKVEEALRASLVQKRRVDLLNSLLQRAKVEQ